MISQGKSKARILDYKIGLATDLKDRLSSYSICFPRGFYIHALITLPRPQGHWRGLEISRALRSLESSIFDSLTDGGVERLEQGKYRTEWFVGRFKQMFELMLAGVIKSGLSTYVSIHDNLADRAYGTTLDRSPARAGRKNPKRMKDVYPKRRLAELEAAQSMIHLSREWNEIIPTKQQDEASEYTVQKITAQREVGGEMQYLVKWKGYNQKFNTWEPLSHLGNAGNRVEEFLQREQAKQRGYTAAHTLLQMR